MAKNDESNAKGKIEPMELVDNSEKAQLVSQTGGQARSHDPDFKGPIKNRSCTDIPCCLLFLLYIIGMVIVGIVAFKEGDLDRLIYPKDSKGNTCGKDFVDKKYLYFFDLTKCVAKSSLKAYTSPSCPTPQVCVEKCPSKTRPSELVGFKDAICINGVKPKDKQELKVLVNENKCVRMYLESTPVLYRCLPTALGLKNLTNKAKIKEGIKGLGALMNAKNVGMKIFEDLKMVWYWILGAFILAMILSLIWIIMTRWIAWPMVWFSIIAAPVLIIIGIYFCYTKYKDLDDLGGDKDIKWEFTSNLDGFTNSKKFWLAAGIILTIVLVILLLIILVLRKRINLAIALIKESSRAIGSMISTLFFPIIPWILQLLVFCWFIGVALFLVSNGTAVYMTVNGNETKPMVNSSKCNPKTFASNDSIDCLMVGYETNKNLNRMAVYHFFGWLWLMNFVIALGECVLAGAFASWYFAFHKPDDVPALPVLSALGRTLRYHTGSLAFGAAIIAVMQFIRAILEYVDHKLKESNQDNKIVWFVMKCMKCCFWCLEKCLRFLNKNAYIGIAIYGKNFCKAAKDAFFLLLRNALRVAAINSVTAFLLFIGKLLVVGVIGVGSFFWFDRFVGVVEDVQLSYSVVPIVVSVIGAWVVAAIFFDVYDMAIDTIFFCFLEDSERNDGSAEKPYYMSDNLRDILGK